MIWNFAQKMVKILTLIFGTIWRENSNSSQCYIIRNFFGNVLIWIFAPKIIKIIGIWWLKFRVLSFKGGHDAWDSWPEMKTDLINWVTLVKLCWPNVTRATVIVIKSCRKKSRRETRNGRSTPTRKNLQYKLPLALFHPLKRYAGNIQWMGIFLKWSDRGAKRRYFEKNFLLDE